MQTNSSNIVLRHSNQCKPIPILHMEKSTKFNVIFTCINLPVSTFANYPPICAMHNCDTTRAPASAPVIFWLITYMCMCVNKQWKQILISPIFIVVIKNGFTTRLEDNIILLFKHYYRVLTDCHNTAKNKKNGERSWRE